MNTEALSQDTELHSWEQTISACIDGEDDLDPSDLDSPYARQVWDTYHLIGDVLRSDDLAIRPSDLFFARLSKQIDAEPAIVAAPRRRKLWQAGASGLALAAAVSTVWFVVGHPDTSPVPAEAPVQVATMADSSPQGFSDFIEAHRELAGTPMLRQVAYDGGVLRQ